MDELLVAKGFYLHKYPIGIGAAFVLADGEGLAAFGRALVDYAEFCRGVHFKEVAQHEFGLGFTVRLHSTFDGYIHHLVEVAG